MYSLRDGCVDFHPSSQTAHDDYSDASHSTLVTILYLIILTWSCHTRRLNGELQNRFGYAFDAFPINRRKHRVVNHQRIHRTRKRERKSRNRGAISFSRKRVLKNEKKESRGMCTRDRQDIVGFVTPYLLLQDLLTIKKHARANQADFQRFVFGGTSNAEIERCDSQSQPARETHTACC